MNNETLGRLLRTVVKVIAAAVFLLAYIVVGAVDAVEWWAKDMEEWLQAEWK